MSGGEGVEAVARHRFLGVGTAGAGVAVGGLADRPYRDDFGGWPRYDSKRWTSIATA